MSEGVGHCVKMKAKRQRGRQGPDHTGPLKTTDRGLDFIFRAVESHWKVVRKGVARCDLYFKKNIWAAMFNNGFQEPRLKDRQVGRGGAAQLDGK